VKVKWIEHTPNKYPSSNFSIKKEKWLGKFILTHSKMNANKKWKLLELDLWMEQIERSESCDYSLLLKCGFI